MLHALHHVCIQTNDYERSKAFYCDVLGFTCIKETKPFHDRAVNAWFAPPGGGVMLEVQTAKHGESLNAWSARQAGPVHLAFLVSDVRAAYAQLKTAGWQNFKRKPDGSEVYLVENSWLCKVVAPEGTEIELRDQATLDE